MKPEYIAIKNVLERQCPQPIQNGFQWSIDVREIYLPMVKCFEENSFL